MPPEENSNEVEKYLWRICFSSWIPFSLILLSVAQLQVKFDQDCEALQHTDETSTTCLHSNLLVITPILVFPLRVVFESILLCCCRCEFNFRKSLIFGVIVIFTIACLRLGERLLINVFYDHHGGQEKTGKTEIYDELLKILGLICVTVGSISQGFVQLKLDMLVSILPEDFRGALMHAQASATVSSSIVYAIYLGFKEIHH